jgi:hypothetical protein
MTRITFTFACGCFIVYWPAREVGVSQIQGGLACCAKHERPNARIADLLPLELVRVEQE